MHLRPRSASRHLLATIAVGAMVLGACGSEGGSADDTTPDTTPDTQAPTTEPATTEPPATEPPATEPPVDDGVVSSLDEVRGAVVRIEAAGTFVDPEFGTYEGAGGGSGFVIGDGNLAVTNNHVVTGAGLLRVYADGDAEPRNARVLGTSECSDLAVIEIDGEQLPMLPWSEEEGQPGTEIYVAGFPLGDPEYTLTRGIISKARASGDTNWASIAHTLEHDAAAQPGNSGGPVVTSDGRVAGIHYASFVATNQSQFLAIAPDVAIPIVEQLAAGTDVDSVGINGQIVNSEDGSINGLWVSGVAAGSAADEAGVTPGDIVTRVQGVSIGLDGTMRDYCDVLRSHTPDDQLAIEVLRFATSEFLDGELNGDVLTTSFSFAQELSDDAATPTGDAYDEYIAVTDDSGTITARLPAAWTQVDGAPTDIGAGTPVPSIAAAPDLEGYRTTWDVPGMEFIASPELIEFTAAELLEALAPTDCVSFERAAYDDGFFVGEYEVFNECGGTDTVLVLVAASSNDGANGVVVAVQALTDADFAALDVILDSFDVIA